jgi:hypothetical protein
VNTKSTRKAKLETVLPPVKLGTALAEFGRRFGGIDLDIERDAEPIEPADFGVPEATPPDRRWSPAAVPPTPPRGR